jgi:hypothetical protein
VKKFLAIPMLILLAVGSGAVLVACKQGEGDRCQVKEDCEDGLTCNQARNPPVCQATNGNELPIDALPPVDAPVDVAVVN